MHQSLIKRKSIAKKTYYKTLRAHNNWKKPVKLCRTHDQGCCEDVCMQYRCMDGVAKGAKNSRYVAGGCCV